MKTLLLALALTLQSASEPITSQKVQIDYPNDDQIVLQTVRYKDTYSLLVEIKGRGFSFTTHVCSALLVADGHKLAPKCIVRFSTEVIPGSGGESSVTERLTLFGGDKLKAALGASSVHVKIGHYEFDLDKDQLKKLLSLIPKRQAKRPAECDH